MFQGSGSHVLLQTKLKKKAITLPKLGAASWCCPSHGMAETNSIHSPRGLEPVDAPDLAVIKFQEQEMNHSALTAPGLTAGNGICWPQMRAGEEESDVGLTDQLVSSLTTYKSFTSRSPNPQDLLLLWSIQIFSIIKLCPCSYSCLVPCHRHAVGSVACPPCHPYSKTKNAH